MRTRITHEHDGDWEHDPHYIVSATTFLVHPQLKTQTVVDYVVSYSSTHMLCLISVVFLLLPNAPYNRFSAEDGSLAMQDIRTQWHHCDCTNDEPTPPSKETDA